MLKNEMNSIFDSMSYEQQKQAMKRITDTDTQAYDDCCNIVEVVVDAVIDVIKVIAKLF